MYLYTCSLCRVQLVKQERLTPTDTWSHLLFQGVHKCPPCTLLIEVHWQWIRSSLFYTRRKKISSNAKPYQTSILKPIFVLGPQYWAILNPHWRMCADGKQQSPINIRPELLLYDPNLRPLILNITNVSIASTWTPVIRSQSQTSHTQYNQCKYCIYKSFLSFKLAIAVYKRLYGFKILSVLLLLHDTGIKVI